MFKTRALADQDGQFVIIPDEIAYDDFDMELDISRHGDVVVIRPVRQPAASHEATAKVAGESPDDNA